MRKEEPQGRRKLKQKEKKEMRAVARTGIAESETDTIQTAPHDQEADAMHNHREATTKRQGVTTGTTTRLKITAETTEVNESDNMIVTADERPGHRVLIGDVGGLCDCSNTSPFEAASPCMTGRTHVR